MELIDGFVYIGRAPRINLYYIQIIFTQTCSWCCYTRSAVVSMATVFDGNPQWSVHSINMNRACTRKKIMDAEASSYDESMSEPVENSNTETADEETTQTSSGEARDDLFERIETWRIITFSLLGVVLVLIVVTVFAVMSRKAPNSESDESVEV